MRVATLLLCLVALGCTAHSDSEPGKAPMKFKEKEPASGNPTASTTSEKKPEFKKDPKTETPKKLSDAEAESLLAGEWEEKITRADQSVYESRLTFLKMGGMSLRGTIRSVDNKQTDLAVTGAWKVSEGKLRITIQTTNAPQLLPVGASSADPLMTVTAQEFSYIDSSSNQTRVLRRPGKKSDLEPPSQLTNAQYEKALMGKWIEQLKLPNGVLVSRYIMFDEHTFGGRVRFDGNKSVEVIVSGTWQVLDGTLHLQVTKSTQPDFIAIGTKSADKIKQFTAKEVMFTDVSGKQVRVMRRDDD